MGTNIDEHKGNIFIPYNYRTLLSTRRTVDISWEVIQKITPSVNMETKIPIDNRYKSHL